jgi:hypothetical protein
MYAPHKTCAEYSRFKLPHVGLAYRKSCRRQNWGFDKVV